MRGRAASERAGLQGCAGWVDSSAAVLIPIGHEGESLRRWPVVTLTIIALCCLAFVATSYGPQEDDELTWATFSEAADYYIEHPELAAHPLLEDWCWYYLDVEVEDAEPTPLQRERQAQLDALTERWLEALRAGPSGQYGWIPGESSISRIVTATFIHGDIFHLFFNMLFLYLSAPLIEDLWGRWFFAAFFFLASVTGSGLFILQENPLPIPLIGASDAIAGVMGAMLIRRPDARIRMLWWWNFAFPRFTVPAWTVLLAWGVEQLLTATGVFRGSAGVAHWTHVYGFAFGIVVAWSVRLLGLERILVRRSGGDAEHAVLRRVDAELAQGRHERAWSILKDYLVGHPSDRDAGLAYWDLAKRLGRCEQAAPILLRNIRAELDEERRADAVAHWADLRAHVPNTVLEVALMTRIAAVLAEGGADGEAEALVREAIGRVDASTPMMTLMKLTRVAAPFGGGLATQAESLARAHPAHQSG